ncbi:leucine-rich repeat protein kinase family protein [Striga asiatica]|uniref:Leucine-rich repeat protein kinase family protein n=1 Tax=Striga asiatica TaxID=4170 RepID=A0A5A7PD43_STRAF|nr:leucine-rich repeat protein kinase family protein [Striga asiatica]
MAAECCSGRRRICRYKRKAAARRRSGGRNLGVKWTAGTLPPPPAKRWSGVSSSDRRHPLSLSYLGSISTFDQLILLDLRHHRQYLPLTKIHEARCFTCEIPPELPSPGSLIRLKLSDNNLSLPPGPPKTSLDVSSPHRQNQIQSNHQKNPKFVDLNLNFWVHRGEGGEKDDIQDESTAEAPATNTVVGWRNGAATVTAAADGCRERDGGDKCRSASSQGRQNRAHLLLHWRGQAARGCRRRADGVLHGRIHIELTLTGRRQVADSRGCRAWFQISSEGSSPRDRRRRRRPRLRRVTSVIGSRRQAAGGLPDVRGVKGSNLTRPDPGMRE